LSKHVSQLPKFLIETTSKTSAVKRSSPAFQLVQKPRQRRGGECFGKAVVSFAPTSASGCTNEAFAANHAGGIIGVLGDPSRVSLKGQTLRGALAWKFGP
jgi:hypothetical protein